MFAIHKHNYEAACHVWYEIICMKEKKKLI